MSLSRIRSLGEREKTTAKSLMTCALIRRSGTVTFGTGQQLSQRGPAIVRHCGRADDSGHFRMELLGRIRLGLGSEIGQQPVVENTEELLRRDVAVDLADQGFVRLGEATHRSCGRGPKATGLGP